MTTADIDFDALKARMKATWMAGDFSEIAKYSETAAEEFMRRRGVKPGLRVLDIACGNGNLAIPAAKAGAAVTGVDIAPNLLDRGRQRAAREGLSIRFDEGDAEKLPYPDASFDLVVSMFGAMFAPRPERVVKELLRVCRPGGQIAMATWTPRGFAGELFKTTGKYAPPPLGTPAPALWGDEATVRERFSDGVRELRMTPIIAHLKYPFSVPDTVELFRRYFGPAQKAFEALPADRQAALREDLESLYTRHNTATDGTTDVAAEYLDIAMTRA